MRSIPRLSTIICCISLVCTSFAADTQNTAQRVARIAAAQLRSDSAGDRSLEELGEYRRQRMEPMIVEAAKQKVDIICFSEIETTRGLKADARNNAAYENATDGPTFQWASALAMQHDINIIVTLEGIHRGELRNLALAVSRDGKLAGVYEKVHPTQGEMKKGIVAGNEFPAFDLPIGTSGQTVKIGMMICHDLSYMESARCLALAGAEIIFWPSLWSGWGDNLNYTLIRSRAIDNGVYLMHVSLAPPEGREWVPNSLMARSGVFDPYGNRLSNAGFKEGLAVCDVDLTPPVRVAPYFTNGEHDNFRAWMFHERRPDAYKNITDPSLVPPKPE